MDRDNFWLNEEQFSRLEPLLPTDTRGVPRADDRCWKMEISMVDRVHPVSLTESAPLAHSSLCDNASEWIATLGDFDHNPCDYEDRRDCIRLIRGIDARSNSVPLKDNAEATSWRIRQQ